MKVLYLDDNSKFDSQGLVIALGFFDGFHIAHMEILNKTLELSKSKHLKSAILTFTKSITSVINNERFEYLTSIDDKASLALSLGFDELILIEPSDNLISMTHAEFFNKYLKDADTLVIGFDYTFGKNRLGNKDYLISQGKNVVSIDEIKLDNTKVGTYEIKKLLSDGLIDDANKMLGRTYSIKGNIYKRNKYYALTKEDYYLPRSGEYTIKVIGPNISDEINAKIKRLDDENCIVIKELDDKNIFKSYERKKPYEIFFTKSSSKSL